MSNTFWHRCPECKLAQWWDALGACMGCEFVPDLSWRREMASKSQVELEAMPEAEESGEVAANPPNEARPVRRVPKARKRSKRETD
jgi:hypothetical protein